MKNKDWQNNELVNPLQDLAEALRGNMIEHNDMKYYTIKETCKILQISRATLLRWIDEGRIKLFKLSKGKQYISQDEIDKLFAL